MTQCLCVGVLAASSSPPCHHLVTTDSPGSVVTTLPLPCGPCPSPDSVPMYKCFGHYWLLSGVAVGTFPTTASAVTLVLPVNSSSGIVPGAFVYRSAPALGFLETTTGPSSAVNAAGCVQQPHT